MSTYYIENGSSGHPYYFNNNATTSHSNSQTYRSYGSPVTFSTNFAVPAASSHHDPYGYPPQHQSVAGFSKTTTQQYYASPSPPPQVRARVRSVGQQEQYHSMQASPQQHHFQFDSRQQPGHPSGPAVVYQTPGAAQFTHRNVDLWTEGPGGAGGNRDHYVQAQRVSVRSVSTGSPTRPQDSLQHYYSQLTPEQHQQLIQRQQQANAHRIEPQYSPPRGRPEELPVQRQVIQQRSPPQEPPSSHPVGIRSLLSKFDGPTPKTLLHHPRSQSTSSSRQYSSSSYTSRTTTTTSTTKKSVPVPPLANLPTVTYSALPKPREPPVNSAEYYQMQMQQFGGQGIPNIQQAAAPAHIQHHSPLPSSGQERFRLGSLSDHLPAVQYQSPPQSPTKGAGNSLSSLRDQYMHQTKESGREAYPAQPMPPVSRTIIGEDVPQQQAPVSKVYQPPQQQPNSNVNAPEGATNEAINGQPDA